MISLAAGTGISLIALYFAFRNVPLADLFQYLQTINYGWLAVSIGVAAISFLGRVLRWQAILAANRQVPFWRAFHPLMIGFMMNCILPARIGEVARPAILKQKEGVSFTTGLATVATERVFDLLLLICMLTIVLATVKIDPNLEIPFGDYILNKARLEAIAAGMVRLCIILIFGIILVSIDTTRNRIAALILRAPNLLFFTGQGPREKLVKYVSRPLIGIMNNVAAGFATVKSFKDITICLLYSTGIWITNAMAYYLIALGCPGIHLSVLEITAVMIIICFFIALPSAPGAWGLWEAGGVFALTLFGVPAKDAAGYSLVSHAVQMFPVIFVGLGSALVYGVDIRQVAYREQEG